MLLTVFYFAASWMQSRRLNSLKNKIIQCANSQKSVAFYKVVEGKSDASEGLSIFTISSLFCKNRDKAMVEEVLHFTSNSRSCALFPQQVVNVDNWITFAEESTFPIKLGNRKAKLKDQRLFLLVEAYCRDNMNCSDARFCSLNQIGIPRAWRAEDTLGLIIESDPDHISKLSSSFLSYSLFVEAGLEICRIQTVLVEGKPCLVIGTDRKILSKTPSQESQYVSYTSPMSEWPRQLSSFASPTQWKTHLDLMRSFSECAVKTVPGQPVLVPEHQTASIVPGNKVLKLDSPTIVNITQNEIEEAFTKSEKSILESSPVNGEAKEMRAKSVSSVVLDRTPKTSAESSTIVSAQSTPSRQDFHPRKNTFSSLYSLGSASTLSLRSFSSGQPKPPNILIYSESSTTTESIKSVLNDILRRHKYTVYSITGNQLSTSIWASNCLLLIICGNVPPAVEPLLTSFLINGGKLLCLCSSFLHSLLPTFRTAEVRERELVHFSYGKWRRVQLMHHVFCYQNSPFKSKFSGDSDESQNGRDRVSPVPQTPSSVEVFDSDGLPHTLHVQVLGVEETWQTPSLLLAYFGPPGGRAVFSQVHLELDPSEVVEIDEEEALRRSEGFRKEILKDILSSHLGLEIGATGGATTYTVAYFLGRHEAKLQFLGKLKNSLQDGVLKLGTLSIKFVGKSEVAPPATASLLPVLVHSCPKDFSTLEYFDNLGTKVLGRLLIYAEVLGSSMDVIDGVLAHGLAVVPSQQTSGKGRTSNQWLSPPGCAMFSLQIHVPLNSYIGSHPSILQHVVSVAIVSSLSEISPEYKTALNLHLKWPNDLYTSDCIKIGGLMATCITNKADVVCNVGCGINLDNELPTTCLNKLVDEYNKLNNKKLKKISREMLFAIVFTKLEYILDRIQQGDFLIFKDLYYEYWLHGGTEVTVINSTGSVRHVKVNGIDEYGFLEVQDRDGKVFTVHPDGNSFDMMEGLIAPKLN